MDDEHQTSTLLRRLSLFFSDADPNGTISDYTATIDWGDGSSSGGTLSGTCPFQVSGSHTCGEEGPYAIKVKIVDAGGSTTTAATSAVVADAPFTAGGFTFKSAYPVNHVVANVSDDDRLGTASDYTATIGWGDGSSSVGTVSGSGPFQVSGSHLYTGIGPFVVTTHVCDVGGSCATATSHLLLEYMTGRAFALSANVPLLVGLSQREVAKRAGVDQADLSRIESAQVVPSLPTLLRLLDVVGGTLVVAHKRTARRQSPKAATMTTGAVESVRPRAAVERNARAARAARTTPPVRSSGKTAAAAKRSA